MRRASPMRLVALLPFVLGLLGMGAMGGHDAGAPLVDVHARLTDVDGAQIDVTHLTVGGDTTIDGEVGRGRLRIPLDRVLRIDVSPSTEDRERTHATVTLREGPPAALTLRAATTFYGQLSSGAFQIRARDLRSVELGR